MELLLGLSYVEDFKVKIAKISNLFSALSKFIPMEFEQKSQQFSLQITILLFLVNMLTDSKMENLEEQKKRFEIQEEDLKKLESLIKNLNQVHLMESRSLCG